MSGDFFLTTWFLEGMKWVYGQLGSVFWTILVCTLLLKLVTVFTDINSRKYSAKMALIQPEIDRVQKRYKDDPRRAQAEQKKIMTANGVSMWQSCLPMLITMPLFFCFIAAFRFWSYEEMIRLLVSDDAVELLKSFKFLWVNNIWQADNGMKPVIMEAETFLNTKNLGKLLYLENNPQIWDKLLNMGIAELTQVTKIVKGKEVVIDQLQFLTTDAAIAAYNTAVQPLNDVYAGYNNGWFILPVLSAGVNFLSMWLTQRNQPKPATDDQNKPAGALNGKMMTYMFPAMSFFICLTSTSAFAIYWTLSSAFMVITTLILNKIYPRVPVNGAGEGALQK